MSNSGSPALTFWPSTTCTATMKRVGPGRLRLTTIGVGGGAAGSAAGGAGGSGWGVGAGFRAGVNWTGWAAGDGAPSCAASRTAADLVGVTLRKLLRAILL